MLTDSVLRELLTYTSTAPVLSVYLNTDATQGTREALKLRLRTLLKGVNLPQDEAAILKYFEHEREWTGRSVAMFSCAARGFFRPILFAVPVRSRVYVGDHPYFKPLADLLDAYGGYGVALVDKQGARLFLFHIGELREQEGILGEEVRHTKRGGASTMPGRRGGVAGRTDHEDETIERNLRDAAAFAARFFEDNHVRRVLVGGTDDTLAQFRGHLPKSWQSLVVGTFPMSMNANHAEVQARALEIGKQAEQSRESRLVDRMITSAAKASGGVVRLEDTLSAVHNGRVQTLIVREGLRAKGWQCKGCGFVTAQEMETCPFCGKFFGKIPDAIEMAVHQVMRKGGDVEIVRDNQRLQEIGIGALLRY